MSGNLLEGLNGPESQSTDAVKALIAFYNHDEEPAEMPAFYRLSGEMVLVLSNKQDHYYVVTAKACSCPSFTYRGGPCKHHRMYFAESKPHIQGQSLEETLRQADANLSKMPYQYRRMVQAVREEAESESSLISRGGFRPVMPEEA